MRHDYYSAPKISNHITQADTKKWPEDIQCIIKAINPQKGSLYLSNVQAAQNPATVKKLKVGAILTCAKGYQLNHPKSLVPHYMYIPGEDKQTFDISKYFDQAIDFIVRTLEKTNIIVHCIAGVSRSVSMVIAYFIKMKNFTYNQAFNQVRSKRKIISPNEGFIQHLKIFEKKIHGLNNYSRVTSPKKYKYSVQNDDDIQSYHKTSTSFYTPKKGNEYYRNLQSEKSIKNPQSSLKQIIFNKKNYLHEKIFSLKNQTLRIIPKFSKSMQTFSVNKNLHTTISKGYLTLNNSQQLSSSKAVGSNQPKNPLNRDSLYSKPTNNYFDTNRDLQQRIDAIRKKYDYQKRELVKPSIKSKQPYKSIYIDRDYKTYDRPYIEKASKRIGQNPTLLNYSKNLSYSPIGRQSRLNEFYLRRTTGYGGYDRLDSYYSRYY